MERELRELQECLKNSEGQEVEKSPAVLHSMSLDDSSLDMPETNYSLEHLTASLRNHNSGTAPRSIGGVDLDDSMVADLLQEYVMPILGLRQLTSQGTIHTTTSNSRSYKARWKS